MAILEELYKGSVPIAITLKHSSKALRRGTEVLQSTRFPSEYCNETFLRRLLGAVDAPKFYILWMWQLFLGPLDSGRSTVALSNLVQLIFNAGEKSCTLIHQ